MTAAPKTPSTTMRADEKERSLSNSSGHTGEWSSARSTYDVRRRRRPDGRALFALRSTESLSRASVPTTTTTHCTGSNIVLRILTAVTTLPTAGTAIRARPPPPPYAYHHSNDGFACGRPSCLFWRKVRLCTLQGLCVCTRTELRRSLAGFAGVFASSLFALSGKQRA